MPDLGEQMGDVEEEMDEVRELVREEVADLFNFTVQIGDVNYNPNNNQATVNVQVPRSGRTDIADNFENVTVGAGGSLNLTFTFNDE